MPAASVLTLVQIRDGWLGLGVEGFPSGHTTAGAAALVSVAVQRPRGAEEPPAAAWRCWPAAVWALTLGVLAVGNVTLHAHLPGE